MPAGIVAGELIAVVWPPPESVTEELELEVEGSVSNSGLSEDALAFLMGDDDDVAEDDVSSSDSGSADSALDAIFSAVDEM